MLLASAEKIPPINLITSLQEPRHLQLLAELEDSSIFSLIAGRKQYGAPTDYGFCIKVPPTPRLMDHIPL